MLYLVILSTKHIKLLLSFASCHFGSPTPSKHQFLVPWKSSKNISFWKNWRLILLLNPCPLIMNIWCHSCIISQFISSDGMGSYFNFYNLHHQSCYMTDEVILYASVPTTCRAHHWLPVLLPKSYCCTIVFFFYAFLSLHFYFQLLSEYYIYALLPYTCHVWLFSLLPYDCSPQGQTLLTCNQSWITVETWSLLVKVQCMFVQMLTRRNQHLTPVIKILMVTLKESKFNDIYKNPYN